MSDSETRVVAQPVTLDTWREAININIQSYKDYLKFAKAAALSPAAASLAQEFPEVVKQHLSGFEDGARAAEDIRNALEFAHDICPDPWRAAFITWCKDNDNTQLPALIAKAKAHPETFSYHGFIGDLCEAFGKDLTKGEHPVISNFHDAKKPSEVKYRARRGDGEWEDISQQELVALARKPDGPHIVHSANHAFLDNRKSDLDSLQKAFSDLFDGSRLPVQVAEQPQTTGHLSTWDKGSFGPNDTITVFATHTRENRFLNLAQLFYRLNEVDTKKNNPKDDTFQNVAPIAVDMVETLLKSIVVDRDVENIKADKDASGKPIFFKESITLRPDAIDIIRRQRYRGFSKGGNDFRDGMRLLVHALDARDADNKKIVHFSDETTSIEDLISNMSVIVFGLNEKPMADYYRQHGVHVPIISSKNDITAPPSVRHEADEPSYSYTGGTKNGDDGHSPTYSVDGMLADWRIRDLLKMHGAVSQVQAAITDVNFVREADGGYNQNALTLEVAHGTTDAMMDKVIEPLNAAMHKAGLSGVEVKHVGDNQGRDRYQLHGEGLVSQENIKAVQMVLRSLCAQHGVNDEQVVANRPSMPLWVSQSTAYGKMSLMRRYLADEQQGKIEPSAVIDKATITPYVRLANGRDLRDHSRTMRNQEHFRVAESGEGEHQRG